MEHAEEQLLDDPGYFMAACWWGLVASPSSEVVRHPSGTPFTLSCLAQLHPNNSRQTLWATEPFWYSAFVPRRPVFHGDPAFSCLEKYDIEKCEGGYRLNPVTCGMWLSLERHSEFTSVVLIHACDKLWPDKTRPSLLPQTFRYDEVHATEKNARRACWKAREAFVNMIGYLAASIAILNTQPTKGVPKWIEAVALVKPSHPYWFHAFTTSPLVADLTGSVPRQGLIIDMTTDNTTNRHLSVLKDSNVPLWYWFPYQAEPVTSNGKRLKDMIVTRATHLQVNTDQWHTQVGFDGPDNPRDARPILLGYSDQTSYTVTSSAHSMQLMHPPLSIGPNVRHADANYSQQHSRKRPFNQVSGPYIPPTASSLIDRYQSAVPALEQFFERNAFPSRLEKYDLASKFKMSYRQIDVWVRLRKPFTAAKTIHLLPVSESSYSLPQGGERASAAEWPQCSCG